MFNREGIKQDFSKAADAYEVHAALQHQVLGDALEAGARHWQAGSQLLDIGCGTGWFAQLAQERGHAWNITGCDMAEGMCKKAQSHMSHILCCDARQLPFAASSFDGVMSSLMLQWLDDPVSAFAQMKHVLRSSGHAVVTTFTERTLHELRDSFRAVDQREHLSPFLSMNQIAAAASSAGFKVKQIREYGVVEHYADVTALMKSIKAIGARMKSRMPGTGMMTPRQLQRVQAAYQTAYAKEQRLPATWRILRLVMQKP